MQTLGVDAPTNQKEGDALHSLELESRGSDQTFAKTLPLQGSTKMSSRVSAIIFTGLVSSTSIRLMRESTCSSPKNFHTCIFFNILVIGTSAQVRHGSSAGDGICLGNEYFEIGVSQRTSDTGKFHVNTPCSGFYGRRSGLSG